MGLLQKLVQRVRGQGAVAAQQPDQRLQPVFRPSSAPVFVCTVSHEPLANLIPLLQHQVPGARALLLCSPDMRQKSAPMQHFLARRGIETTELPLDDSDVLALRRSTDAAREWLADNAGTARWMLNLTGGTKLMSRELERALADAPNTVLLYADTARGRVDILGADTSEPYRNVLTVDDYLRAQGFEPAIALSDQRWYDQAFDEIAPAVSAMRDIAGGRHSDGDSRRSADLLAGLNAAAQQVFGSSAMRRLSNHDQELLFAPAAEQKKASLRDLATHFPWTIVESSPGDVARTERNTLKSLPAPESAVMRQLVEVGLLQHSEDGKSRYAFPNARAAKLVGGFWLEWLVMQEARKLGMDREYLKHGQEVRWRGGNGGAANTNELDLMLVQDARMLIVECKTVRVQGQKDKMNDAIYKLDHLRQYVGSNRSQALLVSANPVTKNERQRLEDLGRGVYYCSGRDLQRLHEFLRLWRDNRTHEWQPSVGRSDGSRTSRTKASKRVADARVSTVAEGRPRSADARP